MEEWPYDTSPVDMEECVNGKVYDDNEKSYEEKEENGTTDSEITTFGEGVYLPG